MELLGASFPVALPQFPAGPEETWSMAYPPSSGPQSPHFKTKLSHDLKGIMCVVIQAHMFLGVSMTFEEPTIERSCPIY